MKGGYCPECDSHTGNMTELGNTCARCGRPRQPNDEGLRASVQQGEDISDTPEDFQAWGALFKDRRPSNN